MSDYHYHSEQNYSKNKNILSISHRLKSTLKDYIVSSTQPIPYLDLVDGLFVEKWPVQLPYSCSCCVNGFLCFHIGMMMMVVVDYDCHCHFDDRR